MRFQQVGVDEGVVNGGVNMRLVVFMRFWGSAVSRQNAEAVWIIDGDFMIELILLLLPVWQEKQLWSFYFLTAINGEQCEITLATSKEK